MTPVPFQRPTGPSLEELRREMAAWRHRQAEQLAAQRAAEDPEPRRRRWRLRLRRAR